MMAGTGDHAVDLRRLYWVGPATVAGTVLVVKTMQLIAITLLNPSERSPLSSEEPSIFTAVLVSIAVVVFAIVGHESATPVRTFRRTAFVALILSCVPDAALGFGLIRGEGWPLAIVFTLMHIAAWAVTVTMLTRLTVVNAGHATASAR
jgi:hypothetical protein